MAMNPSNWTAENIAQLIGLGTLIVTSLYKVWSDKKERREAAAARVVLAAKVDSAAKDVADHAASSVTTITDAIAENTAITAAAHVQTSDLTSLTNEIRDQTNGQGEKLKADLADAKMKIDALQKMLVEQVVKEAASKKIIVVPTAERKKR